MTIRKIIKEVDAQMIFMWGNIGCDIPSNHDQIVKFIADDINDTADPDFWNSSDVSIGFRRWIEEQQKDEE
jgi:hypothetical protein